MASLGHVAVGLAAARAGSGPSQPSWKAMAGWSALSLLPDADVTAFAFGIAYEHPWGHRGASHSLLVATAGGVLAALIAPMLRQPTLRTGLTAGMVLASHGLLDTLTDGGLGCALFWPLDLTRYFAPWRPIPVAPLGLAFLSPYGAFVSAVELILFAPVLFYAFRRPNATRRVPRATSLAVWAASVWLIGSTDPMRQAFVAFVLRADTEYASGFSEQGFAAISNGMSTDQVRQLTGVPLARWWNYSHSPDECRALRIADERVIRWDNYDACTPSSVHVGMSSEDARRLLGPPQDEIWEYSRSRGGAWYQVHNVFFYRGKVEDVLQRWTPLLPD